MIPLNPLTRRVAPSTVSLVTGTEASRSVLLVEDEPLLRELLAVALESSGFQVVTAANAADARRAFRRVDPDGLVLDIDLGSGPNGFDLADALRRNSPHVAVVFLTNVPDPRFVGREPDQLPSGIAYLRKSELSDVSTLIDALDQTLKGLPSAQHRHDQAAGRPLASLTRKQIAVLRLVADGHTNAQIAEIRDVSLKAVEETLSRIFHALHLDADHDGNQRVAATRMYLAAHRGMDLEEASSRGSST